MSKVIKVNFLKRGTPSTVLGLAGGIGQLVIFYRPPVQTTREG